VSDPGSEQVRDRETDEGLLELARAVAEEAAVLVRQRRRAGVEVTETKSSPVDVVTEADRAAEQLIYTRLTRARPGDGFLGEEGSSAESTTGVTWVVDPIDGTVNFLYGIPQYAVSIAAQSVAGPEPETVAAVVLNVATGEAYTADVDYEIDADDHTYLYRPGGWPRARYAATARWGYGEPPAAIVEVTLQVAVNLWQARQAGQFSDIVGVEGGGGVGYARALTNQQRMIIDDVRLRYGQLGVG